MSALTHEDVWDGVPDPRRDRTTASHACHRIEDLRDDAEFDAQISTMEACLRQAPEPWALAA